MCRLVRIRLYQGGRLSHRSPPTRQPCRRSSARSDLIHCDRCAQGGCARGRPSLAGGPGGCGYRLDGDVVASVDRRRSRSASPGVRESLDEGRLPAHHLEDQRADVDVGLVPPGAAAARRRWPRRRGPGRRPLPPGPAPPSCPSRRSSVLAPDPVPLFLRGRYAWEGRSGDDGRHDGRWGRGDESGGARRRRRPRRARGDRGRAAEAVWRRLPGRGVHVDRRGAARPGWVPDRGHAVAWCSPTCGCRP